MTDFTFPNELPINERETLRQLTSAIRAPKDGLPELVKNAKDQYERLGVSERDMREIWIIVSPGSRILTVIDFAGATAQDFDRWRVWSNPTRSTDAPAGVEAGYGNGGKSFMVWAATDESLFESCYKNRYTCMGFKLSDHDDKFMPGSVAHDLAESDIQRRITSCLGRLGLKYDQMPSRFRETFLASKSFSAVTLLRVEAWQISRTAQLRKYVRNTLRSQLEAHPQMTQSLLSCNVHLYDGKQVIGDGPLALEELEPRPGFETALEFVLPTELEDPETGSSISLASGNGTEGLLRLRTASKNLWNTKYESRAAITINNGRNNIGSWSTRELNSAGRRTARHIYGELEYQGFSLSDSTGADRQRLANTPATRALQAWTSGHIEDLALQLFEAAPTDPDARENKETARTLDRLRDLMAQHLEPEISGVSSPGVLDGDHDGDSGDGTTKERTPPDYGSRVDVIQLEPRTPNLRLVAGTAIHLDYRCLEQVDEVKTRPVIPTELVMETEPPGALRRVAKHTVFTERVGNGFVWLRTDDGSVQSNRVPFTAIRATGVVWPDVPQPLLQGQRARLDISFETVFGPRANVRLQARTTPSEMASIGPAGIITVGYATGTFEVEVRYGSDKDAVATMELQIGNEAVEPPDGTGGSGTDIPHIVLCGNEAPGRKAEPIEERTVSASDVLPTIHEDPLFPDVIWLNYESSESSHVRLANSRGTGLVGLDSKGYRQFLALKCFEILKRLYVRSKLSNRDDLTEFEYINTLATAEEECSGFLDDAYRLVDTMMAHSSNGSVAS